MAKNVDFAARYNPSMFWRWLAWGFVLVAAGLLIWSFWPIPIDSLVLAVSPPWDIRARWQVDLQTPAYVRLGETATVTLKLTPPADAMAENERNILVEAGLELPGFSVLPAATQLQPLSFKQPITFTWQITAGRVSSNPGIAPINMQIYPADGGPLLEEYLLSAQSFEIRTHTLLGLDIVLLRFLALSGLVVGVLGILMLSLRLRKAWIDA